MEYILPIATSILTIAASYVAYYFYIRTLVRGQILQGIADIEAKDLTNPDKFNFVVEESLKKIPVALKPFFSHKAIEILVQATFDSVKAYAINRELNNTNK